MPGRWRACCNIAATRVNHGAILNQIVGGVQCRESLHSRYLFLEGVSQMVYILPERLLALSVQHLTSSCEGFEV